MKKALNGNSEAHKCKKQNQCLALYDYKYVFVWVQNVKIERILLAYANSIFLMFQTLTKQNESVLTLKLLYFYQLITNIVSLFAQNRNITRNFYKKLIIGTITLW